MNTDRLLTTLLGLIFIGVGLYFDFLELSVPPVSNVNIGVFTGLALIGALAIDPNPIVSGVKQIVVVVLPIVPWAKRNHDGDAT